MAVLYDCALGNSRCVQSVELPGIVLPVCIVLQPGCEQCRRLCPDRPIRLDCQCTPYKLLLDAGNEPGIDPRDVGDLAHSPPSPCIRQQNPGDTTRLGREDRSDL